jgi:hypothetical protein
MGTTVEQARNLIEERLAELDRERTSLRSALDSLGGIEPSGARLAGGAFGSRRKRARRGQRQEEFLELLEKHRAARVAELAQQMGVKPQQLYPIAHRLAEAGRVEKRDGRYVLVGGDRAAAEAVGG